MAVRVISVHQPGPAFPGDGVRVAFARLNPGVHLFFHTADGFAVKPGRGQSQTKQIKSFLFVFPQGFQTGVQCVGRRAE